MQHISKTLKFPPSYSKLPMLFTREEGSYFGLIWDTMVRKRYLLRKVYLVFPVAVKSLLIPFDNTFTNRWDAKTKSEDIYFINSLTKFEFIIGILSLSMLLHSIAGITKTSGRTKGIIDYFQNINACLDDM